MIVRCRKHDFKTADEDDSACPWCEEENRPKAQSVLSALLAELKRDKVTGEASLKLQVNNGGITCIRKIVESIVR